jgi:hypothetical protein
MDIVSTLVGFLIGTATGAAGTYFADNYTDKRREQELSRVTSRIQRDTEQRFPNVATARRSDFSQSENRHIRAFFIKRSSASMGKASEPCFECHPDKHPGSRAAVLHLEQHGFVSDISSGNTPMYRVHEKLVDALLKG